MRRIRIAGLCGALAGVLASAAAAAPPVSESSEAQSLELGRQLAQRNCGMCHSLAERGASANPAAPPFRDLYQRMDVDRLGEGLAQGILTQHPAMPEFRLRPNELVALVRYLRAMQSRQATDAGGAGPKPDPAGRGA